MNNFWNSWEEVISELRTSGNNELAEQLQDSRVNLNGLTDSWYDFHEAAKKVINEHGDRLTELQRSKLKSTLEAAWAIVIRK